MLICGALTLRGRGTVVNLERRRLIKQPIAERLIAQMILLAKVLMIFKEKPRASSLPDYPAGGTDCSGLLIPPFSSTVPPNRLCSWDARIRCCLYVSRRANPRYSESRFDPTYLLSELSMLPVTFNAFRSTAHIPYTVSIRNAPG